MPSKKLLMKYSVIRAKGLSFEPSPNLSQREMVTDRSYRRVRFES